MGEIVQMMLEGTLCAQCGVVLDEEVIKMDMGIPIYCDDCWRELPKEDRKYLTKESDLLK